jgi:hypothetical protein
MAATKGSVSRRDALALKVTRIAALLAEHLRPQAGTPWRGQSSVLFPFFFSEAFWQDEIERVPNEPPEQSRSKYR